MKLKAVIFDMDGTLADTEEIHRQAFNEAFAAFNIPCHWSAEEYKQLLCISGGKERIRDYLTRHDLVALAPRDMAKLAVSIHQKKSEIYRSKLVNGHVQFRNGVLRLINEARQRGVRLGIATSSSRKNVDTLLRNALGEDPLTVFEAIVTCDIVEDKKPSPAVYQFALAELGLNPDSCIAIEDTHNGNLAALNAGIATVISTHAFTLDDDFAGAALVVDQLGEPDRPFSVLAGASNGWSYVDIDLLEHLLTAAELSWQTRQVACAE